MRVLMAQAYRSISGPDDQRTREGGFRGVEEVLSIAIDRWLDALLRPAGEGVFHEFATDAVQPFRA
jgi:hypothetical protein